jgi:organic hydroperoxide reductase OsmC/OhrA
MSEHRAAVSWTRTTTTFEYASFDRRHRLSFGDGAAAIDGHAAQDYAGRGDGVDPEALFAASIAACHMLSFLAVAARMRIVVDAYEDAPVALVEKGADGRLAVTRVTLKPCARFAVEVAPARLAQMHDLAHRNCFLTPAVSAEVSIEPQV